MVLIPIVDSSGKALALQASGKLGPHILGDPPHESWNNNGKDDRIKDNWDELTNLISSGKFRANLHASTNPGDLVIEIALAGLIGAAAVGIVIVGAVFTPLLVDSVHYAPDCTDIRGNAYPCFYWGPKSVPTPTPDGR